MSVVILSLDHNESEYPELLKNYGIKSYAETTIKTHVKSIKSRIVESNVLNSSGVNYAVLDKDTVSYNLHNKLKEQKILSFLRIDNGNLPAGMLEPIDYKKEFQFAKDHGFVGVKMTTYIDNLDSVDMIVNNVVFYCNVARREKLLPILEFNVRKEYEDKSDREKALFEVLFEKLHKVTFNAILTFSIPSENGTFDDLNRFEIIKLVCGNDFENNLTEMSEKIKDNNMSAMVKNSVLEGLKINLTEEQFNAKLASNIKIVKEVVKK